VIECGSSRSRKAAADVPAKGACAGDGLKPQL
jgi:hypothetical protein